MANAPLQPWRDQSSSASPVEAKAIRLVRKMPPAEVLSPEATARIAARVSALPPPSGRRLRGGLLMLGVGALVVGAVLYLWLSGALRQGPLPGAEHPVEPAPTVSPAPQEPGVVPAPAPSVPAPPPPVSPEVASPSPPPAQPTRREPRPTNGLLEEAKLLGKAVEQLRRKQDPKAALVTLQQYFARYPQGELRGEAEVTRIEALLGSRQKSEALKHLDRLNRSGFEGLPRPNELGLQRAELLAEAGRDPEATRAFTELLARHPAPALEERALFGRAVCRARAGDPEGLRADLDEYLRRFPSGRFAAEARERLKSGSP